MKHYDAPELVELSEKEVMAMQGKYSVPNQHGVFSAGQHETVQGQSHNHSFGSRGWKVQIHLAHPAEHDWRVEIGIDLQHNAVGGFPSIRGKSYPTRQDALSAGVEKAIIRLREYEKMRDEDPAEIRQAIAWCLMRRQLTLF